MRKIIIIYPCLNGDFISYVGTEFDGYNGKEFQDTQYYLVSDCKAKTISTSEAHNIMADEDFFEVLQGTCPTTASGFIDTKLDQATVITGF